MTSRKRIRSAMNMEGRRIPASLAFLRDCKLDVEDISRAQSFHARRIADTLTMLDLPLTLTAHASTQYERDFFDEEISALRRIHGMYEKAPRYFRIVARRWRKRQVARARERRSARAS